MVFHWRLHSARKQSYNVSHLRYASKTKTQCLTSVKLPGSFRLAAGNRHLYRYCIFTEQLLETVPWSLDLSCGPELTRQGITLPLDGYSYRRRLLALHSLSPYQKARTCEINVPALVRSQSLYILLRVKQGLVFLINSRQGTFAAASLSSSLKLARHIPKLRLLFCRVPSGAFTRSP